MVYADGWMWIPKRIYTYSTITPVVVDQIHYMVLIHQGENTSLDGPNVESWTRFCEKVLRRLVDQIEIDAKPTKLMLRKSFGEHFLDICFVTPPPLDGKIFEEMWSEFEAYRAGGWKSWKVWFKYWK